MSSLVLSRQSIASHSQGRLPVSLPFRLSPLSSTSDVQACSRVYSQLRTAEHRVSHRSRRKEQDEMCYPQRENWEAILPHTHFKPRSNCLSNLLLRIIQQ